MPLIKSISGIRGTIGGKVSDNLTPVDAVKFASAYGTMIKRQSGSSKPRVVVGRDGRISGPIIQDLVVASLRSVGIDVIDLDLSTTPTVEVAVPLENADGGIILTASHNPIEWNALKLLNSAGEFLDAEKGAEVLALAEAEDFDYVPVLELGTIERKEDYIERHIDLVLGLEGVDVEAIRSADFSIAVDGVNSTGGIAIPMLLEALGVRKITALYCEPTGHFPHNPEPLAEHLTDLSTAVVENGCDLGITVDPDVDRLAFISEDGSMFGEEYTLVACADYYMSVKPGNTVSNMSSSRALRDVTENHGQSYTASAVGEVNVVKAMKETNATIGGEGNGGIILPALHYGRDALVGVALFLSHLAKGQKKMTELRASYPSYFMSKQKIQLKPGMDVDGLLDQMASKYADLAPTTIDGVKIDFPQEWVHLRKSNTEPIIRVYSESGSPEGASALADRFRDEVMALT